MSYRNWLLPLSALLLIGAPWPVRAADEDEDIKDISSQDLKAGGDANKRYFLIEPGKEAKAPADGFGLVIIMPGGAGSADFHPFVKRIYKYALNDKYLAVQPVAIPWTEDQHIVWPTSQNPVEKMKFTTEEFVEAVLTDVAKKHKLDPARVFTLAWSSSGPAAYSLALQKKRLVTGSFIAMSVFKPDLLPPLEQAKGQAYYLFHSPDDPVCPFSMAEKAKKDLVKNGAKVKLATYPGGHGWRAGVYDSMRTGIKWLEKNHAEAGQP